MQQPLQQELQNVPLPQQQLHQHLKAQPNKSNSDQQPMQRASTQDLLPVFDLSAFLALAEGEAPSEELLEQCRQLAECLVKTGCLVVRAVLARLCVHVLQTRLSANPGP